MGVGDKAPKINITKYFLNTPKDKNLTGKFIVLEFWATWCMPCIEAVPHINNLQKKFINRADLVFLSLTYENSITVKRLLNRVKFKTIVATDETKETELNFNVTSIPHTVLIDNKGVIKLIGRPSDLNDSLIENFLKGKEISKELSQKTDSTITNLEVVLSNKSINNANALFMSENTNYLFYFSVEKRTDGAGKYFNGIGSAAQYNGINKSFSSIISNILKIQEALIITPDIIRENKYTIFYKNTNKIGFRNQQKMLKDNILSALNLKEVIEKRVAETYSLEIIDSTKLPISIAQTEVQRTSWTDNLIGLKNSRFENLIEIISSQFKIIVTTDSISKTKFDFLIDASTLDSAIISLRQYGLELRKQTKEVNFFVFQ